MQRAGLRTRGVTLVELLTVVIVLGILLVAAAPGFQTMVDRNAVVNEANRLVADIQFARSEAVKRGSPVNICRSSDAASCTGDDCACHTGTSAREYTKGWLLYAASGRDTSFDADENTLLRLGNPVQSNVEIYSDSNLNQWLSIGASGSLDESGEGALAVCMNGESTADVPGRLVTISLTGRPLVKRMAPGADCTPGSS
jgi:type IV fimbrial biogenesis protein FimT